MKVVGITGSIASGKTFVINFLAEQGYPSFNCDNFVASLYQTPEFLKHLAETFPEFASGEKHEIAKEIFGSPERLKRLEQLVHPYVYEAIKRFIDDGKESGEKVVVVEIPLLFEAGFQLMCDYVVAVHCDEATRKHRALEFRGMTEDIFNKISSQQLSSEEKVHRSDFVLYSNKTEEDLKKQIKGVMSQIAIKMVEM